MVYPKRKWKTVLSKLTLFTHILTFYRKLAMRGVGIFYVTWSVYFFKFMIKQWLPTMTYWDCSAKNCTRQVQSVHNLVGTDVKNLDVSETITRSSWHLKYTKTLLMFLDFTSGFALRTFLSSTCCLRVSIYVMTKYSINLRDEIKSLLSYKINIFTYIVNCIYTLFTCGFKHNLMNADQFHLELLKFSKPSLWHFFRLLIKSIISKNITQSSMYNIPPFHVIVDVE